MHPFAMETAVILVHSLNRFSLCPKMAAVVVAKLLLCCDIICKRSIVKASFHNGTTVVLLNLAKKIFTIRGLSID